MQDQKQSFGFTGRGGEYFRIWIVNLLLTIVTLGIYSAWAKVRRSQYFYRNTWLNQSSFDYHGNPVAILKGRIIAVALFGAYNISLNFIMAQGALSLVVVAGLALLGVIMAVMPWLLVKSFRFRLHNSSYRGLRFSFAGSVKEGYRNFLAWPLLVIPTVYLIWPFVHQRIKAYQHGNSRFGQTAFRFDSGPGEFYNVYLKAFVLSTAVGMVAVAIGAVVGALMFLGAGMNLSDEKEWVMIGMLVVATYVLMILGSLMIAPYFHSRLQNVIWNHTSLGEHRFVSTLRARKLLWIYVGNFFAMLFTLGLYKPFADIRLAKYRLENMAVLAAGDLEAFVANQQAEVSAVGSEAAEMFDVDVAF